MWRIFLVFEIMHILSYSERFVFFIFSTCLSYASASKFPSWRWVPPNSHISPPSLIQCIGNFENPKTLFFESVPSSSAKGHPPWYRGKHTFLSLGPHLQSVPQGESKSGLWRRWCQRRLKLEVGGSRVRSSVGFKVLSLRFSSSWDVWYLGWSCRFRV